VEIEPPAKTQPQQDAPPTPPTINTTQTIMMIPTRPPLSNAILAELMGAHATVFGSPLAQATEPLEI